MYYQTVFDVEPGYNKCKRSGETLSTRHAPAGLALLEPEGADKDGNASTKVMVGCQTTLINENKGKVVSKPGGEGDDGNPASNKLVTVDVSARICETSRKLIQEAAERRRAHGGIDCVNEEKSALNLETYGFGVDLKTDLFGDAPLASTGKAFHALWNVSGF